MKSLRLAVVTATLEAPRSLSCLASWVTHSTGFSLYMVWQAAERHEPYWCRLDEGETGWDSQGYRTREILGVVPAFALGVQKALEDGAEVIACLHDDLEIYDEGWDDELLALFDEHPAMGLCGFGGGKGLGARDLYDTPYNPMQLARQDFISNMRDAEAHGRRVTRPERVACLDGFSQIGRRAFWQGLRSHVAPHGPEEGREQGNNLFQTMQNWHVVHHFYDGMLGCFAKRLGWEVWMLPIACHHYGGRTAVGDPRYAEWALRLAPGGDRGFWDHAHAVGYREFADVLPIRVRSAR